MYFYCGKCRQERYHIFKKTIKVKGISYEEWKCTHCAKIKSTMKG